MNDADGGLERPSSFKISGDDFEKRKTRGKDYKLLGVLSDDYTPTFETTVGTIKKEEIVDDQS